MSNWGRRVARQVAKNEIEAAFRLAFTRGDVVGAAVILCLDDGTYETVIRGDRVAVGVGGDELAKKITAEIEAAEKVAEQAAEQPSAEAL